MVPIQWWDASMGSLNSVHMLKVPNRVKPIQTTNRWYVGIPGFLTRGSQYPIETKPMIYRHSLFVMLGAWHSSLGHGHWMRLAHTPLYFKKMDGPSSFRFSPCLSYPPIDPLIVNHFAEIVIFVLLHQKTRCSSRTRMQSRRRLLWNKWYFWTVLYIFALLPY